MILSREFIRRLPEWYATSSSFLRIAADPHTTLASLWTASALHSRNRQQVLHRSSSYGNTEPLHADLVNICTLTEMTDLYSRNRGKKCLFSLNKHLGFPLQSQMSALGQLSASHFR